MAAKTSEQAQAETGLLAGRMFASPRPVRLLPPLAGVALLGAVFLSLPGLPQDLLVTNLFVLALPLYASPVLTLAVIRLSGGRTYLRRTTLQAFLDGLTLVAFAVVVGTAQLAAAALGSPFDYARPRLLFLAFAATAWLRHIAWTATADYRHSRSVVASVVTPLLGFAAVRLAYPTTPGGDNALFAGLLAVFLLAAVGFSFAANRPIRQAFGTNGLRLMRHLLDHMTDLAEDARNELEAFFDSFATPAEVRVGAIAFRGPEGTVAVLVVPHAHPGPFGLVAGSDLPAKVGRALSDMSDVVLVPHGPSTHDQNPSTTSECGKVAAAARSALGRAGPMAGGSEFVRTTVGRATATAQWFGDVALVTGSLAPDPTDDVDAATGHAAIHAAKRAGARDALFVDAHNSLEVGSGMVHFGSAESLQLVEAAHAAVQAARARIATSVRVGVAEVALGSPKDGFGAKGLQVLAVEADGQTAAYLLFDGNNMVPGLRDEILEALRDLVDEGEVLTTDNHSVNARIGGYNPVGLHTDRSRIVAASRDAVAKAVAAIRPVETVAGSDTVHGLRVFGHENTARLTSSVNATVSILRPTAVLTFGLALAVAMAILALAP